MTSRLMVGVRSGIRRIIGGHMQKGVTMVTPLYRDYVTRCPILTTPLLQFLERPQSRRGFSQLRGGGGKLEFSSLILQRFFGMLFRLLGGDRVEIVGTQCGIGEHGHGSGLHFEESAG